VLATLT